MEAKNVKYATKIIYKYSYKSHKKYLKLRITVRKFEVRSEKFNVENIWRLVVGLAEVIVVVVLGIVALVAIVVVE